jgi:hypothetical protein
MEVCLTPWALYFRVSKLDSHDNSVDACPSLLKSWQVFGDAVDYLVEHDHNMIGSGMCASCCMITVVSDAEYDSNQQA